MSDAETSRNGALKGPNPRMYSHTIQRPCKFGLECNRPDCWYIHPESWQYNRPRKTNPQGYDTYRPARQLNPLNTNISYASGPKTTSSIPTEWRATPLSPFTNVGSKERQHESPPAKPSILASHHANTQSIARGQKPVDALRKVENNATATTVPNVDNMEVDVPAITQQPPLTGNRKENRTDDLGLKSVVVAAESVHQATGTKFLDDANRSEMLVQTNITSQAVPLQNISNPGDDTDAETMSFSELLSAIVKLRILLNDLDTRKRHLRNNLLSYEHAIKKGQQGERGSVWQEVYEAEKGKLQQIEKDYNEMYRQLEGYLNKIKELTLAISAKPVDTTKQAQENETLRKENKLLREKLESHGKSIDSLQIQLQTLQSLGFMTKDDSIKAAEPLVFRLDKLEGIVSEILTSKLKEEADSDKVIFDQLSTNIRVQQELQSLRSLVTQTSQSLTKLANQQTAAVRLSEKTDSRLQNTESMLHDTKKQLQDGLRQFFDFSDRVVARIAHLERFSLRGNEPDNDTALITTNRTDSNVVGPPRPVTTSEVWRKTSTLELQLANLQQRFDRFTMTEHMQHVPQAFQKTWHPHDGDIAQRLDDLEQKFGELGERIQQLTNDSKEIARTKANREEMIHLHEAMNRAFSNVTADQQAMEGFSATLTVDQARSENTRQELDAINTSMARIEALQAEKDVEFNKTVMEIYNALDQRIRRDGTTERNIDDNAKNLADLVSRVDRLEQSIRSQFDAHSQYDGRPSSDSTTLNSEDTTRSTASPVAPVAPKVSRGLGSSILQTPRHTLKRKFADSAERRRQDERRY